MSDVNGKIDIKMIVVTQFHLLKCKVTFAKADQMSPACRSSRAHFSVARWHSNYIRREKKLTGLRTTIETSSGKVKRFKVNNETSGG